MTLPAAANPASLTLYNLREALAAASWFRTWSGTADAASARARVCYEFKLAENLPTAPYVVIALDGFGAEKVATGTHAPFGGEVIFEVVHGVGSSYQTDEEEATLDALNEWGEFLTGLANWQETVGTVRVEVGAIREEVGPTFVSPAEVAPTTKRFPSWTARCRAVVGPQA